MRENTKFLSNNDLERKAESLDFFPYVKNITDCSRSPANHKKERPVKNKTV